MKSIQKLVFAAFAFFMASGAYAQSLPVISYRDYGYSKPVKQVEKMYYSLDYDRDGSVRNVEEVEKITQVFNADGNIESYKNQSFLDDSWAKSQSVYKQGRLHKQVWTNSNPYLNRTYTYVYDKQGKVTEEKIRFKDGSKSHIKFLYKDSLLTEIESDIDGTRSITTKHYSEKGKLYKETHYQKVTNQADIVTHYFYLEDKEILSYTAPQSYFYATAYLKDKMGNNAVEIKFKLVDDSVAQSKLLKSIRRFEQEAPLDKLPFGLNEYSVQTLQAYEKNKEELKPYRMLLYLHDEFSNIIAEAEVDLKNRNITGVGFSKVEYANGSKTGTTEFSHKKLHIFQAILQQSELP